MKLLLKLNRKEIVVKKTLFLCLVLSLVALTSNAMAAGVKTGMKQVAVQVQYDDISVDDVDVDMSSWVLGGKFGYFFTDFFAVGLTGSLQNLDIEGDDITMYTIGIEPNFYLNMESQIVPYAGLNLGQAGFDAFGEDDSDFYYGAQIGVLAFLNEWAALDFQGRYITYEIFDTDIDDFSFRFGLSVFFP